MPRRKHWKQADTLRRIRRTHGGHGSSLSGIDPPKPGIVPPKPGIVPTKPGIVSPYTGINPPYTGIIPQTANINLAHQSGSPICQNNLAHQSGSPTRLTNLDHPSDHPPIVPPYTGINPPYTGIIPQTANMNLAHQSGSPICQTNLAHQSDSLTQLKNMAHPSGSPICETNLAHKSDSQTRLTNLDLPSGSPILLTKLAHQSDSPTRFTNRAHPSGSPICQTNLAHQSDSPTRLTNLAHQSGSAILLTTLAHQARSPNSLTNVAHIQDNDECVATTVTNTRLASPYTGNESAYTNMITKTDRANEGPVVNTHLECDQSYQLVANTNVAYSIITASNKATNTSVEHVDRYPLEENQIIHTIQGTFHQGHPQFQEHSGRQCVPNSCTAILYSNSKNVSLWKGQDLDIILRTGNELYGFIQASSTIRNKYLLVSELPKIVELFDKTFSVTLGEPLTGLVCDNANIASEFDFLLSMGNALKTILTKYDSCFINLAQTTFAVMKSENRFFVFDSHSRNADGTQVSEGKSVLVQYRSVDGVYHHCLRLAKSMNAGENTVFEITGIDVTFANVDKVALETLSDSYTAESDDIIFGDTNQTPHAYHPLTPETCTGLCARLGIKNERLLPATSSDVIGEPCKTSPIEMDGNCFFRALSYAVSGTQNHHRHIRLATVRHMKEYAEAFGPFLKSGFTSVDDYIKTSRMRYLKTWATEFEILAASDMLEADIFTFSGTWLRYSNSQLNRDRPNCNRAIYLKHCNESHYEVVDCVRLPIDTSGFCTSLCQSADNFTGSEQYEKKNEFDPTSLPLKRRISSLHGPSSNKRCKGDRYYLKLTQDKARQKSDHKSRYYIDEDYREMKKRRSIAKYQQDQNHRETVKANSRQKYRHDKKHKAAVNKYNRAKYAQDDGYKATMKKYSQMKYAQVEKHKGVVKQYSRVKYAKDEKHKVAVKQYSRVKYAKDEKHKVAVKQYSRVKYAKDEKHKVAVKQYSRVKYAKDEKHKVAVKQYSRVKYANDEKHKVAVKQYSRVKYAKDEKHKVAVKQYSRVKYAKNADHKEAIKARSIKKYKTSADHRENLKKRNTAVRSQKTEDKRDMSLVTSAFKENITQGPDHICSVCHRLLFGNQVICCKNEYYARKGLAVKSLAERVISEKYVHQCSLDCVFPCVMQKTPASKLWICFTCHRKILSGTMPAEAIENNLQLEPIPKELAGLNSLERHLVALHIPFAKMMALPKGGQHGVHGPVVCVPSNVTKATSVLPRQETDDKMIRVKLKRKLTYKGHYEHQFVSTTAIKDALDYLIKYNTHYTCVRLNKDWVNSLPPILEEGEQDTDNDDEAETVNCDSQLPVNSDTKNETPDPSDHGMYMDSCLQPVDIGQEILDQHLDNILCLAPAEGNDPVKVLMDATNEAKSFPVLFPTGGPTYHDDRKAKITLARYLHTRLMLADSRFSRNTDYIFYAQYLSELNQVLSSVSIALRKSFLKPLRNKISAEHLTDKESLSKILKCDDGYKFLRPIRGTPAFWQAAQKDLFAMIRQLGISTWFCSFSAGDMRWTEIIETILRNESDPRNADELDWSEKCGLLRRNPVTAARMFDHRFHCFLRHVIMSPANPIGKIKDYFYRVEFQQRGSPHTHCLFWVENAPKVDKDGDEDVVAFIDQYITCDMPSSDDDELFEKVHSVQQHSKKHSKSCRKKGTTCRFNFPRPPTNHTFVCRPTEKVTKMHVDTNPQSIPEYQLNEIKAEVAKQILEKIWNAIADSEQTFDTVDALFRHIGINQELFELASCKLTKKTNIVLRRKAQDVWVNQYNADLLRCWDANMDIQYVIDAYSCVVYIISYISKTEREMGLLLEHAGKEALEGNEDAKQAMKKLGGVYIHNREVSAQEAVYRVCNLKLKECSRKVQFVPTGDNQMRISLPLHVLQAKSKDGDLDVDDMWMTSFVDRYKNRPNTTEFHDICFASFCSQFRVLCKSEISRVKPENRRSTVYELQNGLGSIQKRSRSEPAVVRYARFSATKDPEKYYQTALQLFLPHRCNGQLKPKKYETFQNFYETGAVKCGNNPVECVKDIVDRNKSLFEQDAASIEEAEELLKKSGALEDAWAQICPESEVERISCADQPKDVDLDPQDARDIPDLLQRDDRNHSIEIAQSIVSHVEAQSLLRSLNEKQRDVFFKIRQWCLDKSNGNAPEPFHLFVTGGAGTGKSHLIKTIHYEATRILARIVPNPDDVSVLLAAPTGVAAFNINAATIHSTFSIGVDSKLPYQPLGEEKINSLRSKLHSLQILIIDEISMVDHKLLAYIHGRLRQIKQCRDFSPFGKVSIIAVGDFYQLPPVKGKPLHAPITGVNLWADNFRIVELTKIMRQKDGTFAETLNRLRTRPKSEQLLQDDIDALYQRETGEESDALHIFATNQQVDEYNMERLSSSCSDHVAIDAEDYFKDPRSGKLEKRETQYINVFNSNLARRVTLALDARVMLTKNIDVADGLVNGVFGTVTHIEQTTSDTFPTAVYVVFDNPKVGEALRKKSAVPTSLPSNSTPITAQEDRVTKSGGIRRQYPLKLSFGVTIHRIQGSTLKEAVVSLNKIFSAGQAYVALSRVTTLEGLILQDVKESAIYCNEKVAAAMSSMLPFIVLQEKNDIKHLTNHKLILHNVQGLKSHLHDVKSDSRFMDADFFCLTETWLTVGDTPELLELDGFLFHHKPRSQCYDTSEAMFVDLQQQSHGGVGVYHKKGSHFEILNLPITNLECLVFHSADRNVVVALIYRPLSYKIDTFRHNLKTLLKELDRFPGACLVMGDFNENIFKSSSVAKLMEESGFLQYVTKPTTENGTLIDHVYIRRTDNAKVDVLPTYYSYHEAVSVCL